MKKANTRRFLSPLSVLFVGESESGELSRPLSIGPPRSLAQLASREKALLSHCPEERLSPPIKLSFEKKGKHLESEHAPLVPMRPRGQPLHRALLRRLRLRRKGHARLRRRDAVDRVLDGGAGEEKEIEIRWRKESRRPYSLTSSPQNHPKKQMPQIIRNARTQSAEALSPFFLAEWLMVRSRKEQRRRRRRRRKVFFTLARSLAPPLSLLALSDNLHRATPST